MFGRKTLLASVACILPGSIASAQESRASIAGAVTDASGAVVANARVRLTNIGTAVDYDTLTNEVGRYRYLFLSSGVYDLTVANSGFRTFVRRGVMPQPSAGNPLQTPMRNAAGARTAGFGRIDSTSVSDPRNGQIVERVEW